MRLLYAVFILLLTLMTSAHCQITAEDWYNKGLALYNQSKYDDAIQAYDEALKLDSNYVKAWNGKGAAFSRQDKYDDAIRYYDGLHP